MTILQTAHHFNLTTGLLYTAIARGELAAIRFRPRGRIHLRPQDVRDWIAGHSVAQPDSGRTGPVRNSQPDTATPHALELLLPPQAARRFA